MYLLDTNVVSELRKGARAEPNVTAYVDGLAPETTFLSVITMMEIETGILRIERQDARQGKVLRDWMVQAVMPAFAGRILPVTDDVARTAAAMSVPDPRPLADALIAATAAVANATLVTRNIADFEGAGVQLINPWRAPPGT